MARKWSMSTAIPIRSILASTATSGSSTSRSSAPASRRSRSASSAAARSSVARARSIRPGRRRRARPTPSSVSWPSVGLLAAAPRPGSAASGRPGRRSAGRAGPGRPPARCRRPGRPACQPRAAEREHRALGVVQHLRVRRDRPARRPAPLVVLGQRGGIEVGAVAVRGRDGQRRSASPVPRPQVPATATPDRSAERMSGQPGGDLPGPSRSVTTSRACLAGWPGGRPRSGVPTG